MSRFILWDSEMDKYLGIRYKGDSWTTVLSDADIVDDDVVNNISRRLAMFREPLTRGYIRLLPVIRLTFLEATVNERFNETVVFPVADNVIDFTGGVAFTDWG